MVDFVTNYLLSCKRFTLDIKFVLTDFDYNIISESFVSTNFSRIKKFLSSYSRKDFLSVVFIRNQKLLLAVLRGSDETY